MKKLSHIPLVSFMALALAGCVVDPPVDGPGIPSGDPQQQRSAVPSETHVFVLTEERAPSGELLRAIGDLGGEVLRQHDVIGVLTVAGLTDDDARELETRSDVDAVDRDMMVRWIPPRPDLAADAIAYPEDHADPGEAFFFADFQWYLRTISADAAWPVTNQGAGALVCVLDTGVDPGHIDLEGRVDLGTAASFVPTEPFIEDFDFHGTFVSSLITSKGLGMASVAPHATICPVKVLESVGENAGSGSFDWIISGILHAADVGADVINMSLGAVVPKREARSLIRALARAARYADRRGAFVVASAGNSAIDFEEYPEFIHVPSGIGDITSVAATAPTGQMNFDAPASYTNFGRPAVDVAAPGGDFLPDEGGVLQDLIFAACSQYVCGDVNFYVLGAGTSFSAPLVAGAGAVIESMGRRDVDGGRLQTCLYDGADNIDGKWWSKYYGRGRINVLQSAQLPGCSGQSRYGHH